jgi:hypothetical protein
MKKLLLILLTSCASKNAKVEKNSEEKFPVFDLEEIDLEEFPEAGDDDKKEETP